MNIEVDRESEFCEGCHVGSLRPYRAPYARWHNGQFVVAPRVPAWRCDYCGETFYDDDALTRLFLLLGPESDMEDERRWRATGLDEDRRPELGNRRRV